VFEVKDKALIVREMGLPLYERQVPVAHVKLLRCDIPQPLAELNLKLLKLSAPVSMSRKADVVSTSSSPPAYLPSLVDQAFSSRKRARPNPSPLTT
jgi:hypothetical protein